MNDIVMQEIAREQKEMKKHHESQASTASESQDLSSSQQYLGPRRSVDAMDGFQVVDRVNETHSAAAVAHSELPSGSPVSRHQSAVDTTLESQSSTMSDLALELRNQAYRTMITNLTTDDDWQPIGLLSTTDNHTHAEQELGND